MSKNLTRKGLALGAAVALGSTLIAGTPAFAVDAVTLQPTEGTSYNTFVDEAFALEAIFTDAAQVASEPVKFKVVDSGARLDLTSTTGSGYGAGYDTATNNVGDDGSNSTVATTGALAAHSTESYYVATGNTTQGPTKSYLQLVPTGTTNFSVTVQAFLDYDLDGIVDSGEAASEVRTVNFYAASSVSATTTVDSSAIDDATLTAHVVTTPALNGQQLEAGDVTATVTNVTLARDFNTVTSAYDATNNEWDVTASHKIVAGTATDVFTGAEAAGVVTITTVANHGLVTGERVTITGLVDADANGTKTITKTGDKTFTYTVTDADITDGALTVSANDAITVLQASSTYSATAKRSSTALGTATSTSTSAATASSATTTSVTNADQKFSVATGSTSIVARTGKDVSATYTVKDVDGKVVAGKQVRITVNSVNGTMKVNGTTAAAGTVINAVTSASGQVAVSVDITTESASNALDLTLVAEGVAGTSKSITVDWADAVAYLVDLGDTAAIDNNGAVRSATKGASTTFNLAAVDQWRQAVDGAKYRLKVAAGSRTIWTKFVSISGGRASFTVEDAQLNSDQTTVTINFQKLSGTTWSDVADDNSAAEDALFVNWNGGTAEDSVVTIYYYDQTDIIEVTTPTAQTRGANETLAVDGRTSAAAAFDGTGDTAVTIAGSVKNSITGAKKLGATVTISGDKSILFVVGGVSAFGSLTFVDADGDYSVAAYSNKVLKDSVVTITSGSVSKTAKVSFTASTARADIDSVVVEGSSLVKAGRTTILTVKLLDEYKNVVEVASGTEGDDISVTYDGPGYISSYPEVAVKGIARIIVITGSADTGAALFTVVADGVLDASTDDITVTKDVLIGVTASVSAGKKLATAIVKNVSGATVKVVSGSKVVSKVATSDNFKLSLTKLTAGKKTVKVYVNDILVSSKSVTVKK